MRLQELFENWAVQDEMDDYKSGLDAVGQNEAEENQKIAANPAKQKEILKRAQGMFGASTEIDSDNDELAVVHQLADQQLNNAKGGKPVNWELLRHLTDRLDAFLGDMEADEQEGY